MTKFKTFLNPLEISAEQKHRVNKASGIIQKVLNRFRKFTIRILYFPLFQFSSPSVYRGCQRGPRNRKTAQNLGEDSTNRTKMDKTANRRNVRNRKPHQNFRKTLIKKSSTFSYLISFLPILFRYGLDQLESFRQLYSIRLHG